MDRQCGPLTGVWSVVSRLAQVRTSQESAVEEMKQEGEHYGPTRCGTAAAVAAEAVASGSSSRSGSSRERARSDV